MNIRPYEIWPEKHLTQQTYVTIQTFGQTHILPFKIWPNKHLTILTLDHKNIWPNIIWQHKNLTTQNLARQTFDKTSISDTLVHPNMYHLDVSVGECPWENCSLSNAIRPRVSELSSPYSARIHLAYNYVFFILAYSWLTITPILYLHTSGWQLSSSSPTCILSSWISNIHFLQSTCTSTIFSHGTDTTKCRLDSVISYWSVPHAHNCV